MKVFQTIESLQKYLLVLRERNQDIGFVPTMGALHDGHLKLVSRSVADNDVTVCSIFVNPTQFNNPSDLKKYPRMTDKDIVLLKKVNCDIVFIPSVEDIYPEPDETNYDFGKLESVMEGKFRPGHFKGVAMVVKRLFEIVDPDNAYFGLKDYQQYLVIKALVKQFNLRVNIVGCPTVREKEGLAMSSRNLRLTENQNNAASVIYKKLKFIKDNFDKKSVSEWKNWFSNEINNNPELQLEYIEIVNANNLEPLSEKNTGTPKVACAAVYAGDVRLIDNILINV